jgi:hypothetical protein
VITVRPAEASDTDAVWAILEPMIRVGETYALTRDMERSKALAFWFSKAHEVFLAEEDGTVVGT